MTDAQSQELRVNLKQIENTLLTAINPAMSIAAGQIGKLIRESTYTAEEIKQCLPEHLCALVGPQIEAMSQRELAVKQFMEEIGKKFRGANKN